jgi:hypothetical protein
MYYSPYAFEQGIPSKKNHCDTKSEPPYLAFNPNQHNWNIVNKHFKKKHLLD